MQVKNIKREPPVTCRSDGPKSSVLLAYKIQKRYEFLLQSTRVCATAGVSSAQSRVTIDKISESRSEIQCGDYGDPMRRNIFATCSEKRVGASANFVGYCVKVSPD